MNLKLLAMPLLLGVAMAVTACGTPETETEIETNEPVIEEPAVNDPAMNDPAVTNPAEEETEVEVETEPAPAAP